ncbi:hypothetical protein OG243_26610 [Streptomyces sp. NBC_01318]|uniref:hypothetical protein n=1 Tax=Streptomyces sp. NBC_01318 TaxID=2903823 RepID=UPI002E11BEC0|nr:hypothetical protein OG243_26610 [Streptomyces sp. NBC_01318]
MAHPAVRTDAETLLSDIPAELQSAFGEFLDERCTETHFGRVGPVDVFRAAFHNYCRTVAHCEPPEGTQFVRLLDVAGYLPEWTTNRAGKSLLIVRGIRMTEEETAA